MRWYAMWRGCAFAKDFEKFRFGKTLVIRLQRKKKCETELEGAPLEYAAFVFQKGVQDTKVLWTCLFVHNLVVRLV